MSKSNWLPDEKQNGNFSNEKQDTFDPGKRYIGIRLQQGVPLLDRDWNELEDMRRHAEVMLRRCYIGSGTPDDGFRISLIDAATLDFRISSGRCLVDGFDVVNEAYDEKGNKLDFILYSQQEGVAPLTSGTQGRLDTVYLDVWVEEVSKDQDSALGNSQDIDMETCRRHKLEWRVLVDESSQGYEKQPFHHYYDIAKLSWESAGRVSYFNVEDLRVTGLTVFQLRDDVESLKDHAEKHTHSQLVGEGGTPNPALVVDTEGNVGINTLAPEGALHVKGHNANAFFESDGNETHLILRTNEGTDNHVHFVNRPGGRAAIRVNADPSGKDSLSVLREGNVGIGTEYPTYKLDVAGNISGMSYRNVTESFFVGGDGDKFYAVAFHDDDWGQGPAEFEITRSSVHLDRTWWGSMNLKINWHANNWGHGANFIEYSSQHSQKTFVKDIIEYPYHPYLLVWLRGNTTYYYRSLNNRVVLQQILGTNNQKCSFDPVGYHVYSTAIDCTYRPEGCIPPGTTISGDFYVNGRSHASSRSGPGIDYAEYFESLEGKEIPVGTSVVLKDGMIRPARKNEAPFGIISSNSGLVGGIHLEWPKKYLRDEFGNQIMEEYKEEIMAPKKEKVKRERQKIEKKKVKEKVTRTEIVKVKGKYCQKEVIDTIEREIEEPVFKEVNLYDARGKNVIRKHRIPVMETYEEEIDVLDENGQPVMKGTGKFETKTRPKINPEYDETKEYISREKRPEWNCVGLLGQLPLRKGQPVADTWIKIKDISKDVELWLVK